MIRSVIGSLFGDEGKGLSVDHLSRRMLRDGEVCVVRVNGGAQAGHSVQTPEGVRHVFHQFGAGSLAGARTHLSRFFVFSPMFFMGEKADLLAKGGRHDSVTISSEAMVTTPWDVMINQFVEAARGNDRHGSCGMGFGETIERDERAWGTRVKNLKDKDFSMHLDLIRRNWVPKRLAELEVDPEPHMGLIMNDGILFSFVEECEEVLKHVSQRDDEELANNALGQMLTEGAQGLGLDQDFGDFPHVTRSNTGLRNVLEFARIVKETEISPLYVMRAYATRHGAGPFSGEADVSDWASVVDPTNAPNDWQGSLRKGRLDLDYVKRLITADLTLADDSFSVNPSMGMTCLDQLRGDAEMTVNGEMIITDDPFALAGEALGLSREMCSSGPSHDKVKRLTEENIPYDFS